MYNICDVIVTQYIQAKEEMSLIMDKIFYNNYIQNQVLYPNSNNIYQTLDCKSLKKLLNEYYSLLGKYNIYDKGIVNEFLFSVDIALNKCKFTEIQINRLFFWFLGYNENDIAEVEGVSRQVVGKSINAACLKILHKMQCGDEQ